jgi:polyisoprenoid-binding protein YceI
MEAGETMRQKMAMAAAGLLLAALATAAQEKTAYSIVGAQSKLEIHVGKEGAFKAFAHDHLIAAKEISGEAQFDARKIEASSVRLLIATKSLTVVDPGESENDRKSVQATMVGEKVLDVAKFPEIAFTSSGISAAKKTAKGWELTLSGKLKLHGVEKTVSFPLQVQTEDATLRGEGEISVLQSDYGMTPVKVGGGTVKVKDKLKITFTILARKEH